jgi:hypothetical protein
MSELRRHGRELLEASRRERTPPAPLKRRLMVKLLESAAQTSLDAHEPPPLAQRLGVASRSAVVIALVFAILSGLWLASR